MKRLCAVATTTLVLLAVAAGPASAARGGGLWDLYRSGLAGAKYIDLTHRLTPHIPVWSGFGPSAFSPTLNPSTGQPYTYAKEGFEATSYSLSTDQFGTQLDPPAHWAPEYAAIDELPPTFAVRPLVRRGLAEDGMEVSDAVMVPELTISADGAHWHPVGGDLGSSPDLLVSDDPDVTLAQAKRAIVERFLELRQADGSLPRAYRCAV